MVVTFATLAILYFDFSPEVTRYLLLLLTSLAGIWLAFKWLEYRKMPPGPFGFPIVGYLPFLTGKKHKRLADLSKRYGDIFSVTIGTLRCIVISDYDKAKQVLLNSAHYRPSKEYLTTFTGVKELCKKDGEEWIDFEKLSQATTKCLGKIEDQWETTIHNEYTEFMKKVKSWKGKPTDCWKTLEYTVTKSISSLLISKNIAKEENEPNLKILIDFLNCSAFEMPPLSFMTTASKFVTNMFVWLRIGTLHRYDKITKKFENMIRKELTHRMALNKSEAMSDFICLYLEQLTDQKMDDKGIKLSMSTLAHHVATLFVTEFGITLASIHWLLLIVATHPNIQQTVYQEIDRKIGKVRRIYWNDHKHLPYTMAVLYEMQRWVSIKPLSRPMKTLEVMKIDNHTIPKESAIIINYWSIMRDSKRYKDPYVFNPERFLKNTSLQNSDNFLPFLADECEWTEHIVMKTIFLFFSAIMQSFRISFPGGVSYTYEQRKNSFLQRSIPQKLCFIRR